MDNKRLRKIGIIKSKIFKNSFDEVYDRYKKKAISLGYNNELKFIKDKNRVTIYIELENIV